MIPKKIHDSGAYGAGDSYIYLSIKGLVNEYFFNFKNWLGTIGIRDPMWTQVQETLI